MTTSPSEDQVPPWKRLKSLKETAAILGIGASRLYEMTNRGEISYRKVGGLKKFADEDIEEYLTDCKREKRERDPSPPVKQRQRPRPRLKHVVLD